MQKNVLLLLLAFQFVHLARAQQADSVQKMEDVIIQADRIQIPFSRQNRNIYILTKEDIHQLPVKSVNELLTYVSGIDVRQRGPNGSQADINVDGGSFDQTLVLLNGIKMSDPQTGHNMMNIPVPLEAIERIEILKGASARIYGINAMMGVINIVTQSPMQNRLTANAYSGTSFDKDDSTGDVYWNNGIQAAASYSTDKIGNQLSFGYDGGSGYRYNTAYNNYKLLYTGKYVASNLLSFDALGGYVNNKFGANNFYAPPADKEATEQAQVAVAAIDANIKCTDKFTLKPQINYRYAKDDYIFVRQKPEIYHNIHETNIVDASLNGSIETGVGVLGIGLDWRSEMINSNNLGNNTRNNFGAFTEFRLLMLKDFDINFGAYANYNSVFGFKIYPGLDLGWQATPYWRLYANVGTGQRLPTFTDQYYKSPANIGNPDLLPEWATTGEIGAKYIYNPLRARASIFYRNGINFIDWVRADTSHPWQPQNYTTINTTGFTIDLAYAVKINEHIQGNIYGSYTYLHPETGKPKDEKDENLISQYVINSLQHQLIGRVDFTFIHHFNISIANRFLKRLNTENKDGFKLKSYDIMDARIQYHFSRFEAYADVSNIFNIQYIENSVVPMPGRWLTVGLKFNL